MSKDVLKVKELAFFLTVLPLFALHATNYCATHKPYKLCVSGFVISTISTVADAMHLKSENHPTKIRDDESLKRLHSWQKGDGGEGRAGFCLPLLLLFSLWGLHWVSRLHVFAPIFLSSFLTPLLALLLFLSQPFSLFSLTHSLSLPIWLLVVPRGLIYGCGATETQG